MRYVFFLLCLVMPLSSMAQDPPRRAVLTAPNGGDGETADRLGNFEIQRLLSRFNQSQTLNHDARRGHRVALRENGLRRIGSVDGGPMLFASVADGRVADWVFVREDGQIFGPQTLKTPTGPQGETICWKCGQGGDGNIHCWQIECPVIVAPDAGGDD